MECKHEKTRKLFWSNSSPSRWERTNYSLCLNCGNILRLEVVDVDFIDKELTYGGLHSWIKKRKIKPKRCEFCHKIRKLDLSNISGDYKKDVNDFQWLCRSCHKLYDYGKRVQKPLKLETKNMEKSIRENTEEHFGKDKFGSKE